MYNGRKQLITKTLCLKHETSKVRPQGQAKLQRTQAEWINIAATLLWKDFFTL